MSEAEVIFLSKLEEVLEANSGTLTLSTKLASLPNWDSMAVLSFMALMDADYGVALNPSKLSECVTIRDLYALSPGSGVL